MRSSAAVGGLKAYGITQTKLSNVHIWLVLIEEAKTASHPYPYPHPSDLYNTLAESEIFRFPRLSHDFNGYLAARGAKALELDAMGNLGQRILQYIKNSGDSIESSLYSHCFRLSSGMNIDTSLGDSCLQLQALPHPFLAIQSFDITAFCLLRYTRKLADQ